MLALTKCGVDESAEFRVCLEARQLVVDLHESRFLPRWARSRLGKQFEAGEIAGWKLG
jgi:hypothetical protein